MNKKFFFGAMAVGIMLLNNTATAYAEWSPNRTSVNAYSGEITLSSNDRHNLEDFKRADQAASSGDALFGSTSVQPPVTLILGANIEIEVMTAGEVVHNRFVNGKPCPASKRFNAFVTPIAACSSYFGTNFSGFRAQAEETDDQVDEGFEGEMKWKPMLYMNVRGRWKDLGVEDSGGESETTNWETESGLTVSGDKSEREQCSQVLVQKICQ